MHILDKFKESTKDMKLSFLKYLTPLEYIEYTMKMLLVLDLNKVELCLWISTTVLTIMLVVNWFFPLLIANSSIMIALVISIAFNYLFLTWRKKRTKKSNVDYELKEVKVKNKEVKVSVDIPGALQKYVDKLPGDKK